METYPTRPADRPAVEFSLLFVRLIVGTIFAAHGAQKMWGWFDGPGLDATVAQFENMGFSKLGYAVAIGEFFGGLGIALGFLSRFSAASLIVIMIGAIVKVHGTNGLFLATGGFEYNLALIGLLLPVFLAGPGQVALGRLIFPRSSRTGRPPILVE